jgi:alpha-1,6-mannosyltransferase
LFPSLAYVAVYSLQPHKEWRFIIYTIPPLGAASALGASYIWTHRTKSFIYKLLSTLLVLSILASLVLSTFLLLPASMANYPGAQALNALHTNVHGSKRIISVHMDQLACQTGITRFLELPPPKSMLVVLPGSDDGSFSTLRSGSSLWIYDKTEDEVTKRTKEFWDRFDYALVEDPGHVGGSGKWEVVEVVDGFSGVGLLRPGDEASRHTPGREILKGILGGRGLRMWERIAEVMRKYVTAGWWIEIKTVPKISILRQIR